MRQTWQGIVGSGLSGGRREATRAAACHVVLAAALLAALILVTLAGGDGVAATAPTSSAALAFVPELGLPAREVVAIGASPGEEPTEAWAYGTLGQVPPGGGPEQSEGYTLLEHNGSGPWHRVPLPTGPEGKPPGGGGPFPAALGALAGQTTPAGSVALMTGAGIVVRDPGGAPRLVPAPSGAELLGEGETLPPQQPPEGAPTPYAVYDATEGKAGLMIAPYGDVATAPKEGADLGPGVLDYNGSGWAREPIEAGEEPVRPLAIACGPTVAQPSADTGENCWLLAVVGTGTGRLGLFRRGTAPKREPGEEGGKEEGEEPKGEEPSGDGMSWAPVSVEGPLLGSQGEGGAALTPLTGNAQMLTATSQGVWVDFSATIGGEAARSASQLVEPTGAAPSATAKVVGSWCYPTGTGCEDSLGAAFPAAYRSFAWPGTTAGDLGRRIVTGLPERAMLELEAGAFHWQAGAGGSPGAAPGGAAFATPELGFVADAADPGAAPDGAGQSQMIAVTTTPPAPSVATEPVPFRRPLLSVAPNPDGNGEAIGVGAGGEFGRFVPGAGWHQDEVSGVNTEEGTRNVGIQGDPHENLLAVAWPEPETAYAAGEKGGEWIWRARTGTWMPAFTGGATAPYYSMAFSSADPSRGFMVGYTNVRAIGPDGFWAFDEPPPELAAEVVWTSVAFAANEAIAAWHRVNPQTGQAEGGIAVEDGSGWKIEPQVAELLAGLPGPTRWPTKVAGLPDGGAVLAGPGFVLKRETATDAWELTAEPLPEAADIAALAAFREPSSNKVRAIVSIGLHGRVQTMPESSPIVKAEPWPTSGYLLRETAVGWEDLEHQAYPVVTGSNALPMRPEPVLGLAVSSDGSSILGVGGQTGDYSGEAQPAQGVGAAPSVETGAALRSPAASVVHPEQQTPITGAPGERQIAGTTVLLGGEAKCEGPCADQQNTLPTPDTSLRHALTISSFFDGSTAAPPAAFIYTGGRLGSTPTGSPGEAEAYDRELDRLAAIFSAGGTTPILTTPSPDLTAGGAELFASTFTGFGPTPPATHAYYSRLLPGSAGAPTPVKVIVLAFDASGELGTSQEEWLRTELAAAREIGAVPLVVGSASLGGELPEALPGSEPLQAKNGEGLAAILTEGGAMTYVFDYPGANMLVPVQSGSSGGLLTIGTGTLGYAPSGRSQNTYQNDGGVFELTLGSNAAPLNLHLIPDIESLSLRDEGGPVLKAGQGELFEALARPPAGGVLMSGPGSGFTGVAPEPYLRLLSSGLAEATICGGGECPFAYPPSVYYTSSNPAVGDFYALYKKVVKTEGGSGSSHEVEEVEALASPYSPFFCPKEPGETTVSVTAGGLTYSTPITVVPGEVNANCARSSAVPAVPLPTEAPPPVGSPQPPTHTAHHPTPPPSPAPHPHPHPTPAPHPTPHPVPHPHAPSPAPAPPASTPVPGSAAPPAVAPNPPAGAQPAPPSGVAPAAQPAPSPASQGSPQVSSQPAAQVGGAPVAVPYGARQDEGAQQHAHNAAALRPGGEPDVLPFACLGAVLLLTAVGMAVGSPGQARARAYLGRHRR